MNDGGQQKHSQTETCQCDVLPVLTRLARHMFNSGSIEQ